MSGLDRTVEKEGIMAERLVVDATSLPKLAKRIPEHRGPIEIRWLRAFGPDALNRLRYLVSLRDLDDPVVVDGEKVTVDEAVDDIVDLLVGNATGFRIRDPGALTDEEDRALRSSAGGGVRFYVDGEEDAMSAEEAYALGQEVLAEEEEEPEPPPVEQVDETGPSGAAVGLRDVAERVVEAPGGCVALDGDGGPWLAYDTGDRIVVELAGEVVARIDAGGAPRALGIAASEGVALVAWIVDRTLSVAPVAPEGAGRVRRLSTLASAGPAVRAGSDATFALGWTEDRAGRVRWFDDLGEPVGPLAKLPDTDGQHAPVASPRQTGLLAVWRQGEGGNAFGVRAGDPLEPQGAPRIGGPALGIDLRPLRAGFVATWATGKGAAPGVYLRRLDADGRPIGDAIDLQRPLGKAAVSAPATGGDGRRVAVLWQAEAGGQRSLVASVVDPDSAHAPSRLCRLDEPALTTAVTLVGDKLVYAWRTAKAVRVGSARLTP